MKKFLSWLKGLFTSESTKMTDEVQDELTKTAGSAPVIAGEDYAVADEVNTTEKTVAEKLRDDVDYLLKTAEEFAERFGEEAKAEILKLKSFL